MNFYIVLRYVFIVSVSFFCFFCSRCFFSVSFLFLLLLFRFAGDLITIIYIAHELSLKNTSIDEAFFRIWWILLTNNVNNYFHCPFNCIVSCFIQAWTFGEKNISIKKLINRSSLRQDRFEGKLITIFVHGMFSPSRCYIELIWVVVGR